MDALTVEPEDGPEERVAQHHRVANDRLEDRLHVSRRPPDHAQDLAGRRLLLPGIRLALQRFGLTLPRLCQALLKVADLGPFVRRPLAGERSLGFRLTLRGLCPATHPPLLASLSAAVADSLCERASASNRGRHLAA